MNSPDLNPASLARTITVNDTTLRQIIWRKFDVYAVAGKNFYVMPAQTAGDVRKDDVAVIEFDGERRARKHLFDAAIHLERGLLSIFRRLCLGSARVCVAIASCDNFVSLYIAGEPADRFPRERCLGLQDPPRVSCAGT